MILPAGENHWAHGGKLSFKDYIIVKYY